MSRRIAFLVGTIGLVLICAAFALACDGEGKDALEAVQTPTAEEDGVLTGWPLRTSNRTMLSLCVDGAGGFLISDAQVEAVEAALEESLGGIHNPLPEFRQWEVSTGCPPAPNLFITDTGVVLDGLGAKTDWPSRHLVFVYFLPADSFKPSSDFPYEEMTTEQMCIEYSCYAVTAGLYVNASISQEILREALLRTLGFATVQRAPPDWFLMSGRPNLSLCVDGVGGLELSDEHVQAVREGLELALDSAPEVPAEYQRHEVVAGCPLPSVPLGKFVDGDDRYDRLAEAGRVVDVPSPHRLFVYFMPDDVYDATLAGEPYATTGEEHVCPTDACMGVTLGVYLPASAKIDVLRMGLLRGLRLVESLPNPEMDIDWQACKRGERPHPDFNCQDLEDWRRDLLSLCNKAVAWPDAFPCEDLKDWKRDPEQESTQ